MRVRLPPDPLTPRDPLGFPIDTDSIEWLPEEDSAAVPLMPLNDSVASALFNRIGTLTDAHFDRAGVNSLGVTGSGYFGSRDHLANVAGHAAIGARVAVGRGR